MKSILVTLLVACFLAGCFVDATNPTCADHPIFNMAKPLLTRSVSSHDSAKQMMNDFIEEFAKATPTVLTAEQLGVCSQFAGQSTCCTEKLVNFLDKAASMSGSVIQKAGTPIDQLIKLFIKVMTENSCSTTIGSMTVEDILKDPANLIVRNFYNSMREAKLPYSILMAKMNRGAMCAICAGVDTVTNYLAAGKVKISSLSIDDVFSNLDQQWRYIKSIYSTEELFIYSIYELLENYANQDCKDNLGEAYSIAMMYPFGNLPYESTDPDVSTSKKCSGKVLFNEKPHCETGQDKVDQMDQFIVDYTSDFGQNSENPSRILAVDTEDAVIVNGDQYSITCILPSKTDLKISSNGDLNVSFSEFTNSSESSANTSSLGKLEFIASLAIIIFITI